MFDNFLDKIMPESIKKTFNSSGATQGNSSLLLRGLDAFGRHIASNIREYHAGEYGLFYSPTDILIGPRNKAIIGDGLMEGIRSLWASPGIVVDAINNTPHLLQAYNILPASLRPDWINEGQEIETRSFWGEDPYFGFANIKSGLDQGYEGLLGVFNQKRPTLKTQQDHLLHMGGEAVTYVIPAGLVANSLRSGPIFVKLGDAASTKDKIGRIFRNVTGLDTNFAMSASNMAFGYTMLQLRATAIDGLNLITATIEDTLDTIQTVWEQEFSRSPVEPASRLQFSL